MKRATLRDFDSGTYTAIVEVAGSISVWLAGIPVARNIDSSELVAGRNVALILFDPLQPNGRRSKRRLDVGLLSQPPVLQSSFPLPPAVQASLPLPSAVTVGRSSMTRRTIPSAKSPQRFTCYLLPVTCYLDA